MTSTKISEKLEKILPNKKIFLSFIIILISLTFGSMVALANENTVTVEADTLNVRYGPGLSHDVLTQVNENERLFLLGEENKWYKVRLANDEVGWVASWLVDADDITQNDEGFVRVTGESVNIRQFSNTDAEIIGVVYKDTELQVLYQDGNWYQILYMGRVAWIHADYVEVIDSATVEDDTTSNEEIDSNTATVKVEDTDTNVRDQPSTDGEIIYQAEPNQEFEYIESVDDWHHIRIDEDTTGYVAGWVSSVETEEDMDETEEASTESTEAQNARSTTSLAEATIVVDAGHGGDDPGAISEEHNIQEKDITLSTALLLKERLQDAGTNVILTRTTDEFISLDNRVEEAHTHNADAFISLHYDAMDQANTMSGSTTYYYAESDLEFADTINRYLAQNTPLTNNGVRLGDYYVLRSNQQPSILLELGYMNNDTDTQHIDTPAYQSAVVEAVYQGLREHYGQ